MYVCMVWKSFVRLLQPTPFRRWILSQILNVHP